MSITNLEPLCALYGMNLVQRSQAYGKLEDCENVINKALGVLVENGLYAMSVFLLSCQKNNLGKAILEQLLELCSHEQIAIIAKTGHLPQPQLMAIRKITENLSQLFLARKLMEQALTFGRYHCKALRSKTNGDES